MEKLKEKRKLNKKIIYPIFIIFIIIGMALIYFQRLSFTLMQDTHTRMDLYIGKEVSVEEIKPLVEEVLGKQEIQYQRIETFNDAIAIHVREASEEQISSLTQKIKEKYELSEEDDFVTTTTIPHVRARDIVKPYIVPTIIVTLIIMGYIGVRYMKLGALRSMGLYILKLIFVELLYIGAIGIFRIPIGIHTMPIAIAIYLIVTIGIVAGYQNTLEKGQIEEKKQK